MTAPAVYRQGCRTPSSLLMLSPILSAATPPAVVSVGGPPRPCAFHGLQGCGGKTDTSVQGVSMQSRSKRLCSAQVRLRVCTPEALDRGKRASSESIPPLHPQGRILYRALVIRLARRSSRQPRRCDKCEDLWCNLLTTG